MRYRNRLNAERRATHEFARQRGRGQVGHGGGEHDVKHAVADQQVGEAEPDQHGIHVLDRGIRQQLVHQACERVQSARSRLDKRTLTKRNGRQQAEQQPQLVVWQPTGRAGLANLHHTQPNHVRR